MTAAEIADVCASFPGRHLVATGGEPLLQLDSDLLRALKALLCGQNLFCKKPILQKLRPSG